jgi:hypothetical protein
MDTQQEKQQVESLNNQINTNAGAIVRGIDDLLAKVAQTERLEVELKAALQNVSSVPGHIGLPLFEFHKLLQQVFKKAYFSLCDEPREILAGQGITTHDWDGEFSGKVDIAR